MTNAVPAADTAVTLATANQPGAVAIVQLQGPSAGTLLRQLTGEADWPSGRVRLVRFERIDEGLAVMLADDWAQLMPHGGVRVVERLVDRLVALGARYEAEPDARALYPEAASNVEAEALAAMARAASPAAVDLLLAQPELWRRWRAAAEGERESAASIRRRSDVLECLLNPPTVVVVGPPNVGKSTLTNRLAGRSLSVVADLPGPTRDPVAGMVEVNFGFRISDFEFGNSSDAHQGGAAPHPIRNPKSEIRNSALAVRWFDTPGLRCSADAVEQSAIRLAREVVARADVLIAMREAGGDWPTPADLPRKPDVWVENKVDDAAGASALTSTPPDDVVRISAEHGHGVAALERRVVAALGLDEPSLGVGPWAFCPALRDAVGLG